MSEVFEPLKGLKVVALEQAVAAPFCTARLADAGAEVIKIERPEGDFARGYDKAARGQSSYFVWLNRGKTSVVLDLKSKEGRDQLSALIEEADILVQNLKPGAMEGLGFPLEKLRRNYPGLITCSISGYGENGPFKDRKAYDLLIQAEAGLCSLTGGPAEPSRVGISIVDIAAGASAHAAILEALIARGISGKGVDLHVSMFDVLADWLTVPLLNHEAGNSPKRLGMAHPSIAPYGVFKTSDQIDILISIQSDREWNILSEKLIKDPSVTADTSLATNVGRVENRERTDDLVATAFQSLTSDEAITLLAAAGIAFAKVNDMAGLSEHPQLKRIFIQTQNGVVSYPAPGVEIKGQVRHYGAVPHLGG